MLLYQDYRGLWTGVDVDVVYTAVIFISAPSIPARSVTKLLGFWYAETSVIQTGILH